MTPSPGPHPSAELPARVEDPHRRSPSVATPVKDMSGPSSPSAQSTSPSHQSSNGNDHQPTATDRSHDRIFSPSADAPTPDTEAAISHFDAVMEEDDGNEGQVDTPSKPMVPHHFYPVDGTDMVPYNDSIEPVSAPGVPVFEPTMEDFVDFERYCNSIDEWGMQTGIVKIVPPREWRDSLPPLTGQAAEASGTAIKQVRIRDAITQHFYAAGPGIWRQTNITRTAKQWNLKQWSSMCAEEGQRGPEMSRIKKVAEEDAHDGSKRAIDSGSTPDGVRTRSGRRSAVDKAAARSSPLAGQKRKRARVTLPAEDSIAVSDAGDAARTSTERDFTPAQEEQADEPMPSLEMVPNDESPSKAKVRPTSKQLADKTTEAEWTDFDHVLSWLSEAASPETLAHETPDAAKDEGASPSSKALVSRAPVPSDWNPSAAKVIEGEYWRNLSFGKTPMYGADLKGTFFTPATSAWNVGSLPNLLTRLRLKKGLPGVTTPYLYVGMWRATFAWHVEDMDLYSINYIHFGAPKQWYSIRQADRVRFESTMRGAFPQDAQLCRHFMRHKSYLASPSFLTSRDIKPLRLVQHAQEFVITYPFGYHSGYNLGFNCAESVNFALESWIEIGRKAGFCKCSEESVHMDIDALLEESEQAVLAEKEKAAKERRKMRVAAEKAKEREGKASARAQREAEGPPTKKFKLSTKALLLKDLPCMLCPSRVRDDLIPISAAQGSIKSGDILGYAHRCCASFVPETWVGGVVGVESDPLLEEEGMPLEEEVKNFDGINKDRWKLVSLAFAVDACRWHRTDANRTCKKCSVCVLPILAKHGAKIQCTYGTCPRAVHVSCALGAPILLTVPSEEDEEDAEGTPAAENAAKVEPGETVEPTAEAEAAPQPASTSQHGWFIDLVSADAADDLEGKKKAAAKVAKAKTKAAKAKKGEAPPTTTVASDTATLASDAAMDGVALAASASEAVQPASESIVPDKDDNHADPESEDAPAISGEFVAGERLVVLCRTHNPMHRRAEETRKKNELRERVLALAPGSIIRVKAGGGVFEVLLMEIRDRKGGAEGGGEGSVIVRDGTIAKPSTYKWAKIVWDKDVSATPYDSRTDAALSLAALSGFATGTLAAPSQHSSGLLGPDMVPSAASGQQRVLFDGPAQPREPSSPIPFAQPALNPKGSGEPRQAKPRNSSDPYSVARDLAMSPSLSVPKQRPSLPPISYSAFPMQAASSSRWGTTSEQKSDTFRPNSLPPLQFQQGLPPLQALGSLGGARLPPPEMSYGGSYHNRYGDSTSARSEPVHSAPSQSQPQRQLHHQHQVQPQYPSLSVQHNPGYSHSAFLPPSQSGHRLFPDIRHRAPPSSSHFPYQL